MLVGKDAMGINTIIVGSIVYGPPIPQSIPTLSGSMLVVLGLLLAVLAFHVLCAHSASKPLASMVAAGVLALSAASGNKLIQNAQATSIFPYFCNPSGGVFNIYSYELHESLVYNETGKLQQIISVTASQLYLDSSTSQQPWCTVGLTLQNNSSCYINFIGPPVNPFP